MQSRVSVRTYNRQTTQYNNISSI